VEKYTSSRAGKATVENVAHVCYMPVI